MVKYIILALFLATTTGLPTVVSDDMETLGLYHVGTIDGKSFFADDTKWINWTEARQFCVDANMRLASITSREQLKLLSESFSPNGFSGNHWINGRDSFAWDHDNASVDTSFITLRNQPALQNCLYFYIPSDDNAGVYVSACSYKTQVLCETM